jgi:hypothetical protein
MGRGLWVPGLLLVVALGCGGQATGSTTETEAAGAEPSAGAEEPAGADKGGKPSAREVLGISGPDKPWKEMSANEREFYMIGKVLPITKEVFQEFDSGAYAEFSCESCHGPDGESRMFQMPAPHLPAIPAGGAGYEQMKRDHPEMVRFMEKEVTPTTAKLLGMSVDEFGGCRGCHPAPE